MWGGGGGGGAKKKGGGGDSQSSERCYSIHFRPSGENPLPLTRLELSPSGDDTKFHRSESLGSKTKTKKARQFGENA